MTAHQSQQPVPKGDDVEVKGVEEAAALGTDGGDGYSPGDTPRNERGDDNDGIFQGQHPCLGSGEELIAQLIRQGSG